MLIAIVLIAVVLFGVAFRYYGRFLEQQFGVNPQRQTPANEHYDGIDYVPAKTPVLMGHHFSSIAGAGPIVGPIIAVSLFGWLPAVLWIVIGSILIGGVHDYSALVISIRHKARSIAQVAKELMSPLAHKLYLAFIWLTMIYILTVFVDLTATTYVQDGGVASSSVMYIALAILLGIFVYRIRLPLVRASFIFVPLVFLAIYLGQIMPLEFAGGIGISSKIPWIIILIGYCLVASITPVWVLLQPRDYLSAYLLIACILGGIGGIIIGNPPIETKAFLGFHANIGYLFPALFITIACGACSGFHSIVASGTTAKQLNNERSARPVAYGSMLVEGLLALIAVGAIIVAGGVLGENAPTVVFAQGMGAFLGSFGIPAELGTSFGLLALSTFLLTTLDTATRLARYIFEEFFNVWGLKAHVIATVVTLIFPLWLALTEFRDAQGAVIPVWRAIWPVFGSTNQLLGALALLTTSVWLKRTGRKTIYVVLPMIFMFAVTLFALIQLIGQYRFNVVGIIACFLFILAAILLFEAIRAFFGKAVPYSPASAEEAPGPGFKGGKLC
jgi:carbon starvation protein